MLRRARQGRPVGGRVRIGWEGFRGSELEACTYGEMVLLGDVQPAVVVEVELVRIVAVVGHSGGAGTGAPGDVRLGEGSDENVGRRVEVDGQRRLMTR